MSRALLYSGREIREKNVENEILGASEHVRRQTQQFACKPKI